jgi:hypothetical protein
MRDNVPEESREEKRTPPTPPRGNGDDGFDEFWSAYPKKVDKKEARGVFGRLTTRDRKDAVAAAALYGTTVVSAARDLQFEPGPARWLRGRRWEEWADGPPPGYGPNGNGKAGKRQMFDVVTDSWVDLD